MKNDINTYVKKGKVPFIPIPIEYSKEEWFEVDLSFDSFEDARNKILTFGRAIKVLEPEALKHSIVDYARQIELLYKDKD